MENLEVAIELAAKGLYVFPCVGAGKEEDLKRPCPGIGWRGVSTTDARTLKLFWHRFPTAVPGVDMGKSGLITIDCDRKHGPDGKDWIRGLGIDVEHTPGSITPSGGRHLIYRNPNNEFTNGRGALPGKNVADLDIRGKGGYIIGPGARFADGRGYEPIGSLEQLEELPQVLAEYLAARPLANLSGNGHDITFTVHREPIGDYRKNAYGQKAIAEEEANMASLPEGSRNDGAWKIACKIGEKVGSGCLDKGEAIQRLEAAALSWGVSYKDKALGPRGTIQRGIEQGIGNPKGPTDTRPAGVINLGTPGHARARPESEVSEVSDSPPLSAYTADWTQPGGLLGEMTDYILASSRRPNRPLAVASAVATLSAVCGRWLYGPTGTALNVYIVGLAGTSVGKDRPLSAIGEMLAAAGLARLHTSAKAFSVSAFEQMMVDHPCCVATVDEIGTNLLARMSHKKASTHEAGIRPVILELWSREDGKGPFPTTRHAITKGVKVPGVILIPRPNLSLFGVSTPLAFYEALMSGSVMDGFLNRFLLCEADERGAAREVSQAVRQVPPSISGRLAVLVPIVSPLGVFNLVQDIEPAVRRLAWENDAVRQRAMAFEEEVLVRMDAKEAQAPLLGRVFEYAVRLASLHAVSRGGPLATVGMTDLEWGMAWAAQSAQLMIKGADLYMADGETQATAKAIKRVLAGQGWVTRSRLLMALQYKYKARDLVDVLGQMVATGEIISEEVPAGPKGGRPGEKYRMK